MLLAEDLLLLCIDPVSGRMPYKLATAPAALCAGALLIDLVHEQRLEWRDGCLSLTAPLPASHPILQSAMRMLAEMPAREPIDAALKHLVRRMRPLPVSVLQSLFRRDVLHRVRRPAWWPWAPVRFPLRSRQARELAEQMARKGATGLADADPQGIALVMLLACAGRLVDTLDARAHETASRSLHELSRTDFDDMAPLAPIAAIQRALLA